MDKDHVLADVERFLETDLASVVGQFRKDAGQAPVLFIIDEDRPLHVAAAGPFDPRSNYGVLIHFRSSFEKKRSGGVAHIRTASVRRNA
jgi:hypothetical protein